MKNLKLLRRKNSSIDKYRRVNCIYLYPATRKIDRPHCRMSDSSGESRGDCLIYLGKATHCKFHKIMIKPLTNNERLTEEAKRNRQANLVGDGLCPECYTELGSDKICHECDLSWAYV